MWVLILGFLVLSSCIVLFVFLVQYAQNQNKNDHKIFASYKNSMIGSNLSKIQSSLQGVNQSTAKYLKSPQVSQLSQVSNHFFENIFNYAINFFKFFWNLQPINQNEIQSELLINDKQPDTVFGNPNFDDEIKDQVADNPKKTQSVTSTYKRNAVNPKDGTNLSIEDAKIKTHSTLIIGKETDDEELLGDLNKKNESLIDSTHSQLSKDDLYKLEKFTLGRFNQARGYNKLDIALDLAEIYGQLNQSDLQKELYLWVLNKTSNDDIRHRVVNKLIAN